MSRDKTTEALLDALRSALSGPGEQRLFRAGKLEGLFPGRAGINADAAALALREGLLEVVRIEERGKSSFEWVRLTPRGLDWLHERESPLAALEDLRGLLKTNRNAVPVWMDEMKQALGTLAENLERQARGWMEKLDALTKRVEETLARSARPALSDDLVERIPWASEALTYLDQRERNGAPTCPMPDLFEAVLARQGDLTVNAFHDGLRELQQRRVVKLVPLGDETCSRPELALFDGGRILYRVAAA